VEYPLDEYFGDSQEAAKNQGRGEIFVYSLIDILPNVDGMMKSEIKMSKTSDCIMAIIKNK
jgi:hypothetical protein